MYHTLTVQTNAGTVLGAGGKDVYTTLLTTRASLKEPSGSRNGAFMEIQGGASSTITTRYQQALWNALSMSMKLIIDGVTYTVQSWSLQKDNRKSFIVFNVSTERNG